MSQYESEQVECESNSEINLYYYKKLTTATYFYCQFKNAKYTFLGLVSTKTFMSIFLLLLLVLKDIRGMYIYVIMEYLSDSISTHKV